jgi:hypothetical protein
MGKKRIKGCLSKEQIANIQKEIERWVPGAIIHECYDGGITDKGVFFFLISYYGDMTFEKIKDTLERAIPGAIVDRLNQETFPYRIQIPFLASERF